MHWLRLATVASVIAVLASAFGLYAIKSDTGLALAQKRQLDQRITELEATIAELRAGKAELSRPERIEALTRRHLQLQPMTPKQLVTLADIPWREADPASQPDRKEADKGPLLP